MKLRYRPAEISDWPFLVESFLDSYRTAHAAGLIPMDAWHETMRPFWARILKRPGVTIRVASWAHEDSSLADVAGWIAVERDYEVLRKVQRFGRRVRRFVRCAEPLVLYVYVKELYRRRGIARRLCAAAGVDPSLPFRHATKTAVMRDLKEKGLIPHTRFEPLVVRFERTRDARDSEE